MAQVLKDRGGIYSDIQDNSDTFTLLAQSMGIEGPPGMSPVQLHCMVNIMTKLARFSTGDRYHEDTFIDIANYAILIAAHQRRLLRLAGGAARTPDPMRGPGPGGPGPGTLPDPVQAWPQWAKVVLTNVENVMGAAPAPQVVDPPEVTYIKQWTEEELAKLCPKMEEHNEGADRTAPVGEWSDRPTDGLYAAIEEAAREASLSAKLSGVPPLPRPTEESAG